MRATDFAAIVLAAGASSRLGRPKQLVEIQGEPLVCRAARIAADAGFEPVAVVVGCGAAGVIRALASARCTIVANIGWDAGVASSIRRGIEAVGALRRDLEGALVTACDQPFVTRRSTRRPRRHPCWRVRR